MGGNRSQYNSSGVVEILVNQIGLEEIFILHEKQFVCLLCLDIVFPISLTYFHMPFSFLYHPLLILNRPMRLFALELNQFLILNNFLILYFFGLTYHLVNLKKYKAFLSSYQFSLMTIKSFLFLYESCFIK